jgi:hypothetical protein
MATPTATVALSAVPTTPAALPHLVLTFGVFAAVGMAWAGAVGGAACG